MIKSNKRKVMFVGFASAVTLKSKRYVLNKLYDRAKKNPFLRTYSFDEYLKYLAEQIKTLEGIEVDPTNYKELYNTLQRIGWLKEVPLAILALLYVHGAALA